MISLDSPIWKELNSAGNDVDELLSDLMEGKGDFHEDMECIFCSIVIGKRGLQPIGANLSENCTKT